MTRARSASAARKTPRAAAAPPPPPRNWAWITDAALVLAMALTGARMLMQEPIARALGNPLPGTAGPPLGPGPATGLVLDLCCWLPAFAVLLRRIVDSRYTLRYCGALAVMGALGLWAVASVAWSSNKFGAITGAFHLLSAMILLWSAVQAVRSWVHLRAVAGLCAGLLLALAVQGYNDHFVELPMMRANWDSQKQQVMLENHWTPDSFDYRQFERRVLGGQVMGFSQSPNTYAGLLVLLGTIAAGILLDRAAGAGENGKIAWGIGIAAIAAIVGPLIYYTQCRAAYITPVLTVAAFAMLARSRKLLAAHARRAFLIAAAAIATGFAAIISFGILRGNLIHSSLTFRWWYWIGSARIVRAHPLLGVGWANFGASYLGVRLPVASEEIIDPHNFIVRFFAELGCIGGVLLLIWLVWTAWKLTAGAASGWEQTTNDAKPGIGDWKWWLLTPAVGAILINVFAAVDFTQVSAFVVSEMVNRAYWLAALVVGIGFAILRREPAAKGQIVLGLEASQGLWTARAILVGLGIFLIHNLIEFGIFEPGPMFLVALLVGSALGPRLANGTRRRAGRRAAVVGNIAATGAWAVAAFVLVGPVVNAERSAEQGDDLIRAHQPGAAQEAFEWAAAECPYNAEYFLRAANAALMSGPAEASHAIALLGRAIAADPLYADAYLERAHLEQPASAIADYRRALAIDPNNVRLHLELAHLLATAGRWAQADSAFARAMQMNSALEPHDPKRLSAKQIEQGRPVR